MDTKSITVGNYHCAAWRVSADRWHASAYARSMVQVCGSGADAQSAAEDAARHARLLDEGSPAELDAALASLRASLR
jgi:hypothetical protein